MACGVVPVFQQVFVKLDTPQTEDGCKFLEKRFDPSQAKARNQHMLTATDESAANAKRVVLIPRTGHTTAEPCSVKAINVDETSRDKRMLWVNQMYAVRDGQDTAAFAELFGHFAPRVKSFLMKSGANHDVAEECAQDVMATLWRKAHLFDPAKASVSTWIFTIARNRRIDFLRKDRRPEPEELTWGPEAEPDQADVLALAEDTEKLGEALAALPEKQRNLIEKAYFGDLSHSEIAAQTGLPLGTIKSRIRLALERLRHAMT
jgi:RNA polymerase sigma-70 factor (ECF subfamily)